LIEDAPVNGSFLFWDLLRDISDSDLLTFVEQAVNILEGSLTAPTDSTLSPQHNPSIRKRGWMIYLFQISKPIWSLISQYAERYEAVMNEKKVAIFVIIIDYVLNYVVDTGSEGWSEYDIKVLKHFVEISDNQILCQSIIELLGEKLNAVSTISACKACGDEIPFEGLWASACGNGHIWSKLLA
jgi:hypothetical protein